MWCDSFDADLLKVVPGAVEALGPAGDIRLFTYSTLTDGKINCPASWNGTGALFWTDLEHRPDACWSTSKPVAGCTFLEAVRDEWVHYSTVVVNDRPVWQPPGHLMMRLMYDLRGWTKLSDEKREEIRESVRRSLKAAGRRVTEVAAP